MRQGAMTLAGTIGLLCAVLSGVALAADEPAATVDGRAITVAQVDAALTAKLGNRTVEPAIRARLFAEALEAAIDGTLLEKAVVAAGATPTDAEIETALTGLLAPLRTKDPKFDPAKLAALTGRSPESLRGEIRDKLSVRKLIGSEQKPEAIEAYFKTHHRQFDGTELRVKHILLRPLRSSSLEEYAPLLERAQALRAQILAGALTFDEAVARYSDGPSRARGGDLGYIRRDGPLVEQFTQAAFALEGADGAEISPPLATPWGVHLIMRTASKPGLRSFAQVREPVTTAFLERTARERAARLRGAAKIEYSAASPHFRAGTRELITPQTAVP